MNSVLICGRWQMPLLDGKGGHYRYLDTASHRNAACFLHLIDGLQSKSAVEYFGGVGIFSTVIQRVIHPPQHWAFDVDLDCVRQLQTIEGLQATDGDAHETMGTIEAELVVCDFPVATLRTIDEWPWSRVVASHPPHIVVSDTAFRRLGLHRATYSRLASQPVHTFPDYINAYSASFYAKYGYSVTRVAHHVYAYMMLEPIPPGVPEITKVLK
jgi:hypothetical protein